MRIRPRVFSHLATSVLFLPGAFQAAAGAQESAVSWDFSSPSEYVFDDSLIEISAGAASLRLADGWDDPSEPYRRSVDVLATPCLPAVRTFQLETLLGPSDLDFTKTAPNGRDLRFVDASGAALTHWTEAFDPLGERAMVTLALPALAESTLLSARLYHGDGTKTSSSSWEGVFMDVLPAPPNEGVSPAFQFDAFPTVQRLPSGDLVVVYRTGSGHLSRDGAIALARSEDGGASWTNTIIYDDTRLDDRVDLGLTCLADGTLLLPFYQYIGAPTGCFLMRSDDGGHTWSDPSPLPKPVSGWMALYGQIVELADGTLLLPGYGTSPPFTQTRVVILESSDGGWTWSLRSMIASWDISYTETSIAVLGGQSLIAILRDGSVPPILYRSFSDDAGFTWSTPEPLFEGCSPSLFRLQSGALLLGSSDRVGTTGVRLTLSTDEGQTWAPAVLLDPGRESDVGYPSFVQSPGGTITMVHYTSSGGIRKTDLDEAYVAENPNFDNFFDGLEDPEVFLDWMTWRISGWPSAAGITTDCRSGMLALFLDDSQPMSWPCAIRTLYSFERTAGRLSFWVRADSLANGVEFALLGGSDALSADSRFRFRITPDGGIEAHEAEGGMPCALWRAVAGTVARGVWTKITLDFDAGRNEAEILVNGLSAGVADPCEPGADVSFLGFYTEPGPGSGDRLLVDDIYGGRSGSGGDVTFGGEESRYSAAGPSIVSPARALPEGCTLDSFSASADDQGAEIRFQLSDDGGALWLWWSGAGWTEATEVAAEANLADTLNAHIASFPLEGNAIAFRAFLLSNGAQPIHLEEVEIGTAAPLVAAGDGQAPIIFEASLAGPNPTRDGAAFQVALPERRDVAIRIFDVSGRRLRTVRAPGLSAGSHRLVWDGEDNRGRPVREGVYFFAVDAGRDRRTGRVLILR